MKLKVIQGVGLMFLGKHQNMVFFTIKPDGSYWRLTSKLPGNKLTLSGFESMDSAELHARGMFKDWLLKCSLKSRAT